MLIRKQSVLTLVMVCAAPLVGACYSTVEAEPVGYAQTTGAPVDIETYPSVVYEGQPVYFYGDHWWYRDHGAWTYYHDEPAVLHSQRSVVIHQARRPRVVHEERR